MSKPLKVFVEMTDTQGIRGSANCSWTRRTEFQMPEGSSRLAIIRRAKKEIGCDSRTVTSDYGDHYRLDCLGECIAVFIQFRHD